MGAYHKVLSISLAAASANAIALSQTPGGAGNLTINGSLASGGVATMDVARRVLITTTADETSKTFTIYGTDRYGNTISEVVNGVNNTTVNSVLDYKTVTRIAVSNALAGAVTVGTSQVASSAPFIVDRFVAADSASCAVEVTGTENYSIEVAYIDDAPNGWAALTSATGVTWYAPPNTAALTSKTASAAAYISLPFSVVRLTQNSGTGSVLARVSIPMGYIGA